MFYYIEVKAQENKMKKSDQKRFKARGDQAAKARPLQGKLEHSPRELRVRLGLTQSEFWAPAGVSQSGGSRYESGRKLPASINTLLYLVHIEGIDLSKLSGDAVKVGNHLKRSDPATFSSLLMAARALED
jgi:DNA-binding transcriptional regulator YiaG